MTANTPIDRCYVCRTALADGMRQCRKCKAWNNIAPIAALDDTTVLLGEAIGKPVERVQTGLVDLVFGGGMVRTSCNLLGGEPGAGKTTLSLQLSDEFCSQFKAQESLYIANEQSPEELTETAKRLDLKHMGRIRIVKAMGGFTYDIGDLLLRYNPCFIVLDSVTKWAGEDNNLAVIICQRLKDYCVKLNCPALVINQVTKSGDHAGLNKMQHAVDWTGMFDIELDEGEVLTPETLRRLWCLKNRFGPAPVEQYFAMMSNGLEEIELDD